MSGPYSSGSSKPLDSIGLVLESLAGPEHPRPGRSQANQTLIEKDITRVGLDVEPEIRHKLRKRLDGALRRLGAAVGSINEALSKADGPRDEAFTASDGDLARIESAARQVQAARDVLVASMDVFQDTHPATHLPFAELGLFEPATTLCPAVSVGSVVLEGDMSSPHFPVSVFGQLTTVAFEPSALAEATQIVEQLTVRAVLASQPGTVEVYMGDNVSAGHGLGALRFCLAPLAGASIALERAAVDALLRSLTRRIGGDATRPITERVWPAPLVVLMLPAIPSEQLNLLSSLARAADATGMGLVVACANPADVAKLRGLAPVRGVAFTVGDGPSVGQPVDLDPVRPAVSSAVGGGGFRLEVHEPPAGAQVQLLSDTIPRIIREGSKTATTLGALLERLAAPAPADEFVEIVLGTTQGGQLVTSTVGSTGEAAVGVLLIGTSGSGKSVFLHSIAHSIAARYSPDDVELWLVDLKDGTEFVNYIPGPGRQGLAHARYVGIEVDPVAASYALAHLADEVRRRNATFRETSETTGKQVRNLGEYRSATGATLPRIVAVFDEFQRLFTSGDSNLNDAVWEQLKLLAQQGRSAGVHLVMSTQELAGMSPGHQTTSLEPIIRTALQLRVVMNTADRSLIENVLGVSTDLTAMGDKGTALVYNHSNGAAGVSKFRGPVTVDADILAIRSRHRQREQIVYRSTGPTVDELEAAAGAGVVIGRPLRVGAPPLVVPAGQDTVVFVATAPQVRQHAVVAALSSRRKHSDQHVVFVDYTAAPAAVQGAVDVFGSRSLVLDARRSGESLTEQVDTHVRALVQRGNPLIVAITSLPRPTDTANLDQVMAMSQMAAEGEFALLVAAAPDEFDDRKLSPVLQRARYRLAGAGTTPLQRRTMFPGSDVSINVSGRRFWFADMVTGEAAALLDAANLRTGNQDGGMS